MAFLPERETMGLSFSVHPRRASCSGSKGEVRHFGLLYRAPALLNTARRVLSAHRASRYSEQCVT